MVKRLIQIVLAVAVILLAYVLFEQIMTPLRFQKTKNQREAQVIENVKDIRLAERAFKQKYARYTSTFDSLINFILNDSLPFKKSMGSADDSVAVARGLVKSEESYTLVRDTVFAPRKLTEEQIRNLRLIPHGNGQQFLLDAGFFKTESEVVVPVFECKAPYKAFLSDLTSRNWST
ncbi:MAG: hypothetical protein LBU95_06235 [Rikenellaceae bacterium]|jgi:hypothetical protein|nr:hypothetical protein [Rikenellaceae bacterium]